MENGNIAAGYVTDLGNLIERFQLKRSVRYSDFCEAWQELEFYKVFYGRKLEHDQAEYTDTVYQITTKFLVMKDCEYTVNVAALYALYGLWLNQRCPARQRIRIIIKDFVHLEQFIEEMKSMGHADVASIFYRMQYERAFDFCVMDRSLLVGHNWQTDIFYDECSAALDSIVSSEPINFEKSLDQATRRLTIAYDAYSDIIQKIHSNLPPNADPIDFQNIADPSQIVAESFAKIRNKCDEYEDVKASAVLERRRLIKIRALGMNMPSPNASPTKTEKDAKIKAPSSPLEKRKKPRTMFQRYLQKPSKIPIEAADDRAHSRIKRGRPFVKGVESRQVQLTDYGKVWAVRSTGEAKVEVNGDSGVSSNASNCDDEDMKVVASRVERIMERQHATLEREVETTERLQRLEDERQQVEEERVDLQKQSVVKEKRRKSKAKEKEAKKLQKQQAAALKEKQLELENRIKTIKSEYKESQQPASQKGNVGRPKGKPGRPKGSGPVPPKDKGSWPIKAERKKDLPKKETKKEAARTRLQDVKLEQKNSDDDDITVADIKNAQKRKRKLQEEKDKVNTKRLKMTDLFGDTVVKKPSPKKKAKVKAETLTLELLKVDDFVAVKSEDHYPDRKPLLAQVTSIDMEEETFEAVWWKKTGTKVGKLLYEFRWAPDLENREPNGFCIEDCFQRVQLRANFKLTAKGAKVLEELYQLESDHVSLY